MINLSKLAALGLTVNITMLMGCSSAGPFVKNVYKSGENILTVEKCTIHNGFFILSEENCTMETFKLAK